MSGVLEARCDALAIILGSSLAPVLGRNSRSAMFDRDLRTARFTALPSKSDMRRCRRSARTAVMHRPWARTSRVATVAMLTRLPCDNDRSYHKDDKVSNVTLGVPTLTDPRLVRQCGPERGGVSARRTCRCARSRWE